MSIGAKTARKIARHVGIPVADIPLFLCPSILKINALHHQPSFRQQQRPFSQAPYRKQTTSQLPDAFPGSRKGQGLGLKALPKQCGGCGALSQAADKDSPGYFTLSRKSLRAYLGGSTSLKLSAEDEIVRAALKNAGSAAADISLKDFDPPVINLEPPICDRCHGLKHHDTGVSIQHPSISSLRDTLSQSPYKYNHVYHVLDAADFPMSLVPGVHKLLSLTKQRSKNRRAKSGKFYHNVQTEVSFVITRSDLLAPSKEQVDSMMPYLQEVLRDALGRAGKDVRLGNIRCVSAKQAWWTKELKEDIWKRGGGGWLVGRVNVGKSRLFQDVFPKGRGNWNKHPVLSTASRDIPERGHESKQDNATPSNDWNDHVSAETTATENGVLMNPTNIRPTISTSQELASEAAPHIEHDKDGLSDGSFLLPPAPLETDYPQMPLVSCLPGTTASPIRLSFGSGKGELIDLPGLRRGDLELHVQPEHRPHLVMRSRIHPKQMVLKPGQSLLLGGFIRITPTDPDLTILAYAFTPINPHVTRTEKAIGVQSQTLEYNVPNISLPGTGEEIASAGVFHLKWDVTRQRAGPVTNPQAGGIKPEDLPYRIFSTDVLIEGCGWVELVAQVSKRYRNLSGSMEEKETYENSWEYGPKKDVVDPGWPAVEIFSPEGKFIAARKPMNAWLLATEKHSKARIKGRPRKSMRGAKKQEKQKNLRLQM